MMVASQTNEIALILAILLSSLSQVLLRIGSRNRKSSADIFFNVSTAAGYLMFLTVVVLTIYAMQKIDLKTAMAWSAVTYLLTPLISFLLIKEPLDKKIICGSVVIMIGIFIFIS